MLYIRGLKIGKKEMDKKYLILDKIQVKSQKIKKISSSAFVDFINFMGNGSENQTKLQKNKNIIIEEIFERLGDMLAFGSFFECYEYFMCLDDFVYDYIHTMNSILKATYDLYKHSFVELKAIRNLLVDCKSNFDWEIYNDCDDYYELFDEEFSPNEVRLFTALNYMQVDPDEFLYTIRNFINKFSYHLRDANIMQRELIVEFIDASKTKNVNAKYGRFVEKSHQIKVNNTNFKLKS